MIELQTYSISFILNISIPIPLFNNDFLILFITKIILRTPPNISILQLVSNRVNHFNQINLPIFQFIPEITYETFKLIIFITNKHKIILNIVTKISQFLNKTIK
jgi:hypothetical protein